MPNPEIIAKLKDLLEATRKEVRKMALPMTDGLCLNYHSEPHF